MEYQEDYNIEQEEPQKRPEMLTVLCILSFINAVWNAISNFINFAFYDVFQNIFVQMKEGTGIFEEVTEEMIEEMGDSWNMILDAASLSYSVGRGYYFLEMVLFIASFIGVLMMWRLQKKGFHVYTVAQILMLIAASVFVTSKVGGGFPFGPIFWTALFVFMYYPHYKKTMK